LSKTALQLSVLWCFNYLVKEAQILRKIIIRGKDEVEPLYKGMQGQ
jgi:hypothetical protein